MLRKKKAPVKVEGNLMFTQRKNPYCDLLHNEDRTRKIKYKI